MRKNQKLHRRCRQNQSRQQPPHVGIHQAAARKNKPPWFIYLFFFWFVLQLTAITFISLCIDIYRWKIQFCNDIFQFSPCCNEPSRFGSKFMNTFV